MTYFMASVDLFLQASSYSEACDQLSVLLTENGTHSPEPAILDWRYTAGPNDVPILNRELAAPDAYFSGTGMVKPYTVILMRADVPPGRASEGGGKFVSVHVEAANPAAAHSAALGKLPETECRDDQDSGAILLIAVYAGHMHDLHEGREQEG